MSDWVDVDKLEDFSAGEYRIVDVDDTIIAVINLAGEFFALQDICSHDGAPLLHDNPDAGELLDGEELMCPRHGARFCIRTGAALSAPAYEPVCQFPVRVENGVVQVRDHRFD